MNKRSVERKQAEWDRAYESPERVEWVRSRPSIVSGNGPCENAHVRTGGIGMKADACWIVPLTSEEHHELHQHGIDTFQKKYGVDLDWYAEQTELAWRFHKAHAPTHAW